MDDKEYLKSPSIIWWVVLVIVIALLALLFLIFKSYFFAPPPSSKTNRELVLTCTTDMATQFHIHPHLQILILDQQQEIPADIGIVNGCMNAIHTHDNTGKIHVESPEKRDFTLDDFFAVWQKTYNKNQIFDYKTDDTHVIKETINGQETQDYQNTILRDNDQIVISYQIVENKTDIEVFAPKANEVITSPLKITGIVRGNGWSGFEGQVGTVHLLDSDGKELAVTYLPATSEWTKLPTNFETTLKFLSPKSSVGSLVFHNENASGDPVRDKTFVLAITFK